MAILDSQRDFSSGELNTDAKRRDDQPLQHAGARQLRNWRVLNSGGVINRPGRRAAFQGHPRADRVQVAPGQVFWLCFDNATLTVRNADGTLNSSNVGYPWTVATVNRIVWALVPTNAGRRDIVFTFGGNPAYVATWVSGTGWTFSNYNFAQASDASSLVPFYRLSAPGARIKPSATTGAITIVADAPAFVPGMVGTLIRWIDKQILITGYTSSTQVSATVIQTLYSSLTLTATAGFNGGFAIGDIISDSSGAEAEVWQITGSITSLQVNMMTSRTFGLSTGIYGPSGSFVLTGQASIAPGYSVQWDEAVFSAYRGWPQSCFFDQNRLGFCDIPALPNGIAWSRVGQYGDFLPDAVTASDPIFEIAPESSRVYHVATKQDEIVLTDRGIWHIPISETNPLKPGSVTFKKISVDAASTAKPSETNEGIVFIGAGLNRIVAVVPTGTMTRPWETKETSLFHQHLFNAPFAIVSTVGDDTFAERYVYVLNGDGTMAVGKYDAGKQWVGWLPWDCKGTPKWVSVLGGVTSFVTLYGGCYLTETIDASLYLDGGLPINNVPPPLAAAPGLGPLWWLTNNSVDLMDGLVTLGTYQVDGTGNVIPNSPGEDLSSVTLTAGQSWTSTLEPFVPNAAAGADQKQRTRRRRILRIVATVENSTGFKFSKLYNGPKGVQLPAPGTEIGSHRITAWNQDDNQAVAPPLRDQTYTWRPTGRAYDPRIALVKDVPGPLTVVEIGMEVTT